MLLQLLASCVLNLLVFGSASIQFTLLFKKKKENNYTLTKMVCSRRSRHMYKSKEKKKKRVGFEAVGISSKGDFTSLHV